MKCENCNKSIEVKYGSGRFCSSFCARSFSSSINKEIRNNKISNSLKIDKIIKECPVCNSKFEVIPSRDRISSCSRKCSGILRWKNQDYRDNLEKSIRERCSTIEEKSRLRDIGRKGGFGNKGKLENGINYSSNLEKECFQFLVDSKIKFIPHKNIPNSSKISDIYFEDIDLYIELDGINRKKKQKWLEDEYKYWLNKLEIYEKNKLNYKIIYSLKEFKEFILCGGIGIR